MKKNKLTALRAVWLGLLSTPVLIVSAVLLVGTTAGSAGPSATAAADATSQAVTGVSSSVTALGAGTQTMQELLAYWTPERMASAQPYPLAREIPSQDQQASGAEPVRSGTLNLVTMNRNGSISTSSVDVPAASAPEPQDEPFHDLIPYTQWQYFAKYLPNSPGGGTNVAASAQHKMFFSQDHDGNGSVSNFVCSSSTIGTDAAWTAGHCVNNGLNGAGANGGASSNVLHCPSYDTGVNATAGCWGAAELWWSNAWRNTGNLDHDMGATDTADTGTVNAMMIGSFTGVLGIAYVGVAEGTTEAFNANWVSFGYPAGAPFNGNKIQNCTSSFGYTDGAVAGGQDSKAIGCDMTGGSSGGPWLMSMGIPGQIGGGGSFTTCCNFVFGHNDWRHTAEPDEMNSPPYNCLALALYRAVNDLAPQACP